MSSLREAIHNTPDDVLNALASALKVDAPTGVLPGLLKRLHAPEVADVEALVRAVRDVAPDLVRPMAVELLRDRRESHVALARTLLVDLPEWADPDHETPIDQERDIERLIRLLHGAPSPDVRARAATRLGQLGDQRALTELIPRLKDACATVVGAALGAIHALVGDEVLRPAQRVLTRCSPEVRPCVADFLARLGERGVDVLLGVVGHQEGEVCTCAANALARWQLDRTLQQCRLWLNDRFWQNRELAARILGRVGQADLGEPDDVRDARRNQCIVLLKPRLRDPAEDVRARVLGALAASEWPDWHAQAQRMLKDKAWEVRAQALALLGRRGEPSDLDRVVGMLTDEDEDVRKAALSAAAQLAPDQAHAFALRMITDRHQDVAQAAVDILDQGEFPGDLVDVALEKLRRAKGGSGGVLVDLIRKRAPDRARDALRAAVSSRSEEARAAAAAMLARMDDADRLPTLRTLIQDREGQVRLAAFRSLLKVAPAEGKSKAFDLLEDTHWEVRLVAVQALADDTMPHLVDDLLPLARDEDGDVRREAIRALAKFDDVRVWSELVSSLNDVDDDVREAARQILQEQRDHVPVLKRFADAQEDTAAWQRLQAKVAEINRWAARVGQELLGRPVVVHQYRQSLGRTWVRHRHRVVHIEVTDTPVTTGHPFGEDIMRGIALHEIGHHVCDIGVRGFHTIRGIARAEGLGDLFDILVDERLERALRSRRPEWGTYFDRLASYAFAQGAHLLTLGDYAATVERTPEDVLEAMRRGELPGKRVDTGAVGGSPKVMLRNRDMLAIPGLVPPTTGFLVCLRCGFDAHLHPDLNVAAAIACVPENLKDASAQEVLELSREIGDLIGRHDDYQQEIALLRRRMRQNREAMRSLGKMLDRLAGMGQAPDWMRRDAPGIRQSGPEIIHGAPPRRRCKLPGGQGLNLGPRPDFDPLPLRQSLPFDPAGHAAVVARVRKHIRHLRTYLERLGQRTVDQYASRRGHRVDVVQARKAIVAPSPNLLVFGQDEPHPDAYLGVLIDRSGSMEGEKIERARAFGVLVAESAKGLRGIQGHVNAFDDDTFYALGDFHRNAIASLQAGGGNNDAGGLALAAALALKSGKRNRLLIMVSDGSPTDCTVEALKNLVARLGREYGIVCVQVAVDRMEVLAFPHYVDLSQYGMNEALTRFGRLIIQLTAAWR